MSESGDIIIEDPEVGDMEVVEASAVEDDDQKSEISDRGNPNETSIMV